MVPMVIFLLKQIQFHAINMENIINKSLFRLKYLKRKYWLTGLTGLVSLEVYIRYKAILITCNGNGNYRFHLCQTDNSRFLVVIVVALYRVQDIEC